MKWITTLSTLGIASALFVGRNTAPKSPLIVHEWGTITTRHAADGTPRGYLNHIAGRDTLPSFVYRWDPPSTQRDPNRSLVKTALVAGRPDVTMRLETPVMYFYAPRGAETISPFDVDVHFRGGVVNEFYPKGDASVEVDVDRPRATPWNGALLDSSVIGRLRWRGVALEDSVRVVPTTSHVWLAPRQVHALSVTMAGESERYLFYRGVAHLDALVQTRLTASDVELKAPKQLDWLREPTATISNLWLLDVRRDGSAAFREQGPLALTRSRPSAELAHVGLFAEHDYAMRKLSELRSSMKRALTSAGLTPEEADAMLDTWGESYFREPGLRIFYIVPPAWVNYYLPVEISAPHQMTRVIVGRIDLEP